MPFCLILWYVIYILLLFFTFFLQLLNGDNHWFDYLRPTQKLKKKNVRNEGLITLFTF